MSDLASKTEPVEIILQHSIFEHPYLATEFKNALLDLWSFTIFKPILDLCATKCFQKTLIFKVSNRRVYEIDEGNCKTITTPLVGVLNKFMPNKFKVRKSFEISIKKIDTFIIIHEIAHMVEQACELDISDNFASIMAQEISATINSNSMAKSAVQKVLVKELQAYPKSKIPSELFARIYQLLGQSKEIYGYAADFAFSYDSISKCFPRTIQWLKKHVDPRVNSLNLQEIVNGSKKYLKAESDRSHSKWTGKRVKSFHKQKSGTNNSISKKSKWTSNISSIKDDPFE